MRRGALALILVALAVTAGRGDTVDVSPSATREAIRLTGRTLARIPSRAALDWCGLGQPAAIDRKPEVDVSSPRQVHVSYAIPADAADQLVTRAGPIATDLAAVDAWWRSQDGTRALRFDLFDFPGCTSTFGKIDIGLIRLPRTANLYLGEAGTDRLLSDMSRLTELSTSHKHLVYYDGRSPFEAFVCGTSFVTRLAPNLGGLNGIAFVWLNSTCGPDLGTGRIAATVAVHEVIHGLGALISGSPNECDPPNDGHVCDSTTDILYPEANSQTSLATQILDVNRDDYYGHGLQSFDVQKSDWLSRLPRFPLAVTLSGTGGTVRMTSPTSVDCEVTCSLELDSGTPLTLVATAQVGKRFLGWRDGCSGLAACQLTMDAPKSVTAAFGTARFRLAVARAGKGKVVSTPAGISCPSRCTATFGAGATVRLRATPAKGFRFASWNGACSGAGPCLIPIDRNRTARAIFRKR